MEESAVEVKKHVRKDIKSIERILLAKKTRYLPMNRPLRNSDSGKGVPSGRAAADGSVAYREMTTPM